MRVSEKQMRVSNLFFLFSVTRVLRGSPHVCTYCEPGYVNDVLFVKCGCAVVAQSEQYIFGSRDLFIRYSVSVSFAFILAGRITYH